MTRSPVAITALVLLAAALSAPPAWAADARPHAELSQKATWTIPTLDSVREAAQAWLAERPLDDATRAQIETLWSSPGGAQGHLLDLLATTFAAGDPAAQSLVATCSRPRSEIALPDVAWLADEKTAALQRSNLRLLYTRWLVSEALYDEALEQLKDLKPEDVVDPAALLFYRAVVGHHAFDRTGGLAAIGKLLENESSIPKRYVSLARLMQADLEGLKDESLDHIARRMDDVRRRLDLGRAGPKVREVEDGVIASLDKLIDEMEKQQQAAAAAAAAGSGRGNMHPSMPAQDSRPMQGKGPGEVAKKPIGNQSGWGDLPPRQRQEALQQIGKDFPAHYRDMIEQYFRKLANEDDQSAAK
jgi:hypothetical protein